MSSNNTAIVATTLEVNGVKYVRADSVSAPIVGNRHVVVIDSGYIYAGDVVRKDGFIHMSRVLHLRAWTDIGFDGVLKTPKSPKVVLKPHHDIVVPFGSEIFSVPVDNDWGL